jgi:pimeloyl-ACP methyl ester carboxylesterase
MNEEPSKLTLADRRLAYQQQSARRGKEGAGVVFLGGYGSDMNGTKASFLAEKCAAEGRGLLRFDYRGHGQSSDVFENGTIGDWFSDACAAFDLLTQGPQILVGSSMGGWIGLLLARARPERVVGFVGVAAAPDFTEDLIRPMLTEKQKEELARDGITWEKSDEEGDKEKCDDKTRDNAMPQDRGLPITQKLMEEAKAWQILKEPLAIHGPVRLLQGQKDKEVPWRHALKIMEKLATENARLTLIKDGEHNLNRPEDLELLWETLLRVG